MIPTNYITERWDRVSEAYVRTFSQDVDEDSLNCLIGKCVRGEGESGGQPFYFATIIVGWERTVLGNSDGTVSQRYTLLTEDGFGYAVTSKLQYEVCETIPVLIDKEPFYFVGEVLGSQLYEKTGDEVCLFQKLSVGGERAVTLEEVVDPTAGNEFVSVPHFLLEEERDA